MSDVITSREDVFLGKIAGRNVDISSWTPPVANGVHEEILAEIADRIDNFVNGGGGGGAEPLIVTITATDNGDTLTCDKTWKQINDAFSAGTPVVGIAHYTIEYEGEGDGIENWYTYNVLQCSKSIETYEGQPTENYAVYFANALFNAQGENDYPVCGGGGDVPIDEH